MFARKTFFAAVAILSCRAAFADAAVRHYAVEKPLVPGETAYRDVKPFPPPPYYATSPFALAFAPKFELPGEEWDVVMLRLNILAGSHRAVYAIDIGVLGGFADYKMDGIAISGLFNSIGESDGAIQIAGLVNLAAFDFSGCQIAGVYCGTEGRCTGLQIAVGNYAGHLTGVQIGVFNYAERLDGVQIGLLNCSRDSWAPMLPVLNMSF